MEGLLELAIADVGHGAHAGTRLAHRLPRPERRLGAGCLQLGQQLGEGAQTLEEVARGVQVPMPAFRSRIWSSSCAASSTALWRHSAARKWTAMMPVRWIRWKSPKTNA